MANKRMFNGQVLDTDAFLDMPLSAQALYFHLNLRADDDGFISNPKRIQSYIGASEDDLKLLVLKSFVIAFEDGVIVIKHWRMHNTIQKDRYHTTIYQEDLAMLGIKDNKAYTLDAEQAVNNMETKCIQNVSRDLDIDIGIDKDINKKKKPKPVYFENETINNCFLDFIEQRKKIKAPMTDRAIELSVKKLMELSKGDTVTACRIINQSIMYGWKGFFPLCGKEAEKADPKFTKQYREQLTQFNNYSNKTTEKYDFAALEAEVINK